MFAVADLADSFACFCMILNFQLQTYFLPERRQRSKTFDHPVERNSLSNIKFLQLLGFVVQNILDD